MTTERPGPPAMNLKQVARALDVHYMTAYRYVRHGRLPAWRDGSVWMVDPGDVAALRRSSAGGVPGSVGVDWSARLSAMLAAGDEVGGWSVLRDALASGHDLVSVHLQVVAEAMASVSEGVASGERPSHEVRVAATVAVRLVARLGGLAPRPGRKRGTVIVVAPAGEHHGLALLLVANVIRHCGARVIELGTDVRPAELVACARAIPDLAAIAIGVSDIDRVEAVRELIVGVRTERPAVPVLVGGRAVANPEIAQLVGASTWSAGDDLAATVSQLLADRPAGAAAAGRQR